MDDVERLDNYNSNGSRSKNRFAAGQYRDWFWGLLFYLHLAAVLILGVKVIADNWTAMLHPLPSSSSSSSSSSSDLQVKVSDAKTWELIVLLMLVAAFFSTVFLLLTKWATEFMIKFTLIVQVVFLVALTVFLLIVRAWLPFVLLVIADLFTVWFVISAWRLIPFAADLLTTAFEAIETFSFSLYAVVGAAILASAVWIVFFEVAVRAVFIAMGVAGGPTVSSASTFFTFFGLVLSFFWTMTVIRYGLHTTVSGTVASWYFLYPTTSLSPSTAVFQSFRRAATWSFGSICFGALIVAVVAALRATVEAARNADRKNLALLIVACIVDCILGCIQDILEIVNRFAFSYVAIYGYDYCSAGRATFDLLKSRGLLAVFNDSIVGMVLFIGSLCVGLGTLAVAMGIAWAVWQANTTTLVFWAVIGFLTGVIITLCIFEMVEAAVTTLFVCFADDPAALSQTKPMVYQRLAGQLRYNAALHNDADDF